MTSGKADTAPTTTPEQMIAEAIKLRPRLLEEQAATEARTYYSRETHEIFERAGFYGLFLPKAYGGSEFGVPTFYRLTIELARGCPSTAWGLSLAASHGLQFPAWFGKETQEDFLGDGKFFAMAAPAAPMGVAERVDGGWRISGTARYASGIPYSTHVMGQVFKERPSPDKPPELLLFVADRDKFTMVDDWGDVIGLKGSGSHSARFDGAVIPDSWVMDGYIGDMDASKTPGYRVHDNPMYVGRSMAVFTGNLAAVVVGAALGALDEYERMMNTKPALLHPFPLRRKDPEFQRVFGNALTKLATAEAALMNAADQYMELCERAVDDPDVFGFFEDYRLAGIAREVIEQCWNVMHGDLWRTAGTSAGVKGERMERLFRDLATVMSHRNLAARDLWAGDVARAYLREGEHADDSRSA
jgi:3-hydroxy-9,10-secoandrosta-1,3,5(10)-triene-9,17-dione monooxygenase